MLLCVHRFYDSETYSIGFETRSCGFQTVMWLDGCGFVKQNLLKFCSDSHNKNM